jgi:hypothetical protein
MKVLNFEQLVKFKTPLHTITLSIFIKTHDVINRAGLRGRLAKQLPGVPTYKGR